MFQKKIFFILMILSILFNGTTLTLAQQRTVRIGVVIDGPWERNEEIRAMTQDEILTLTQGEFVVIFPDDKLITADWTTAGVSSAIDRLLADPDVDLILTMGVLASGDVSTRGDLPKPVIAPFVIDAELQDLPSKDGASGVKNLNYLSLPSRTVNDMRLFREIVWFNKVTILINKEVWDSIPELSSRIQSALQNMEIEPLLLPVERTVDSALAALTPETEAVYLAPLLHLLPGHFERLIQHLIESKIPSFSVLGIHDVEQGILATASPDIFPKIARRIALNVQRILLGEDPGAIPTAFAIGEQFIINMQTARKIELSPPFSVMTEAVLLNEQTKSIERYVSLTSVMQEAVDKNLDIAAETKLVSAGRQNINVARSQLLPKIEVSSLGLMIDEDRAEASFGSQAQRTWTGSASATQLIFSERAWANLAIQKHLQQTRIHDLNRLRLDIVAEAATAYLNVLRAKTFETIQKENLKRTRSNLELAQVRQAIGYSGPSDLFRWESEIAINRRQVIESIARRNLAEIELNRLLHRPTEESFATEEADLSDPALGASREGILDYYDDPNSFDTFREFMTQEALTNSPELLALDAALAAKKRESVSASNAFWAPTIALQADITRVFRQGGAGTTGLALPPTLQFSFPEVDDTNWNIGLNFSYPLFEGSRRFAERTRASEELRDLQLTLDALAERIEQRIRSALHLAGATRVGIQLSRDAAEAAKKNLDLVTDAYSSGLVDILGLLDAQNSALNADLSAANAVYDFLLDLIEVERALGGFYYFASQKEKDEWFARLQKYFEKAGVSPRGRR